MAQADGEWLPDNECDDIECPVGFPHSVDACTELERYLIESGN